MEKPATPKAPQEVKPEAPTVAPPPYIPPAAGSPSTGPGGLAIAALIVGIVAILSCFVPFWGLVVGIAAIILGVLALKKPAGKGFGIAGIVLGGLGTLINLVVVAFFVIALFAAGSIVNEAQDAIKSVDESSSVAPSTEADTQDLSVPVEYRSALSKADSYANRMNMSKQGVYDQLVSEYGEQFTPEAAQYAVDNVKADWNANALAKAKTYQDTMNMSPAAIRDQLVSEYGEKFTQSEADYAIQNL